MGWFGQRPELSQVTGMALVCCILGKFLGVVCHCFPHNIIYNYYYYYYRYSALGPDWAETRAQSGDCYGSGMLHSGQVLRGSLPLLSPIIYIYNKPTRYDCGSTVFINNYKYVLHVSDALCVHLQEHYKL